jgi:hypothetical protein
MFKDNYVTIPQAFLGTIRGTTQASGVVGPSESTDSSKEGLEEAPGSRQGKDQKQKEFIEMENKNSPFIITIK